MEMLSVCREILLQVNVGYIALNIPCFYPSYNTIFIFCSSATMVKDSLTISKEEFLSLQQQLSEREAECTKLQELNRDLSHKVQLETILFG